MEVSGPLLSGRRKITVTSNKAVIEASTRKTASHPKAAITKLPTVGAMIGETPRMRMSNENIFAFSFTGNTSRTIALGGYHTYAAAEGLEEPETDQEFHRIGQGTTYRS